MVALSRLFIRDRETPSSRVRIRHELAVPADSDGSNGDVCIVADGASAGVYIHTSGAWTEIGSGSSTSLGYYDPRATPASPHANDLEFLTATTGLTLVDPASSGATLTHRDGAARISLPHSASVAWRGARAAAPAAGEWSVTARVRASARALVTNTAFGIAVAPSTFSANPATTNFTMIDHLIGGLTRGSRVVPWTNYTTAGSVLADFTNAYVNDSAVWQRIRYNPTGTVLSFDRSDDGLSWHQLFTTASPGFVPTIVLVLGSAFGGTAGDGEVAVDFLRFTSSASLVQNATGKVV